MSFHSIIVQYFGEVLVFGGVAFVVARPFLRRRDPRKVLLALSGPNLLRFGGVAGALAMLRTSPSPSFLIAVAIGDGLAAIAGVVAVVLLARRSARAVPAVIVLNLVGLLGILTSEVWLQCLEFLGLTRGSSPIHGPTIGAALFTAVHLLALSIAARVRASTPARSRAGWPARTG